jgi:hypothetical protein
MREGVQNRGGGSDHVRESLLLVESANRTDENITVG